MYKIGDIVFAKLKGFRHWPAKVIEIIENKENNVPVYKTTCFGDLKKAKIHEANLLPYAENTNAYGTPLPDNAKNKIFNKALKEAETAYKASKSPKNDISQHRTTQEENLPSKHRPIEDIQAKLQKTQDTDLETSLTLAAEIGNALLSENTKLKQDLQAMVQNNAEKVRQTMESSNLNVIKYQEKIEELENEKHDLLCRNATLTETINKIEHQISKEKKTRNELLTIFEEQDKEKEHTIQNLEAENASLQKITRQMENERKKEKNEETLATETKNALLSENTKLKKELQDMALKNAEIVSQTMRSSNLNTIKHQERIKELENEKHTLQNRNAILTDTINKAELQLSNEKITRDELLYISEKQDIEKEHTIQNLQTENTRLQNIIRQMEDEIEKEKNDKILKMHINPETQTLNADMNMHNHSINVLLQLTQLKNRQDQIEHEMKTIKERLHSQPKQEPTAPQKQSTPDTTNRSSPRYNPSPTQRRQEKRKNHYSVSLQVAKNHAHKISATPNETEGTSQNQTKNSTFTIPHPTETKTTTSENLLSPKTTDRVNQQSPDKTTKINQPQIRKSISTSPQPQNKSMENTQKNNGNFLGINQWKRNRIKETYRTKIYLNSQLTRTS